MHIHYLYLFPSYVFISLILYYLNEDIRKNTIIQLVISFSWVFLFYLSFWGIIKFLLFYN